MIVLLALSPLTQNLGAQNQPIPREYQVKAAFLYNFTRFVDWPPERFETDDSPIVIAILGRNPFGNELHENVAGREVNGRKLVIELARSPEEASGAHLLFVAAGEERPARGALDELHKAGVLTVGESEEFRRLGGVITFTVINQRIRFHINRTSAEQANLRISSQLMQLGLLNP